MNRIMHPFFSTKPKGKGTGLGLSISHGIVENHGGKLTISSVEDAFTEVVVELPLLETGMWDEGRETRDAKAFSSIVIANEVSDRPS
jgi:nitrogen-specific signal transduction histidine kinase